MEDWNSDFRDLFAELNKEGAEFLVVGGYAVIFWSEPRYTKDLDILVRSTVENAERVWRALAAFGAPMDQIAMTDLVNPQIVVQLGRPPTRIDVLMGIGGVDFEAAWRRRAASRYADQQIWILSLSDLVAAKRAAGRPRDLLDLDALREVQRRQMTEE